MLAGLLKAPSKFSPASNPAVARARARSVLARMVDAGLLPPAEGGERRRRRMPLLPTPAPARAVGVEYAVDAVLERLPPLVGAGGARAGRRDDHRAALQRRAQAIGARPHGQRRPHASMPARPASSLLDMRRRHPRAGRRPLLRREPVQSRAEGQAAARLGVQDVRVPGRAGERAEARQHRPGSADPRLRAGARATRAASYRGDVTLRDALALSMNAAAARLNMTVGPRRTAAVARRLGIRSELREEASLALGTSEVTLIELTGAYGVLANGGRALDAAHHHARAHRLRPRAVRAPAGGGEGAGGAAARRRHERHAQRRARVGHRQARGAAASSGRRQDRHLAGFPRRLVRRLHGAFRRPACGSATTTAAP